MVSILMPIYNGIQFIDESIGSILNQTFTNYEVLIGINGWEKNSAVYIKAKEYEKYNQIKVFDFFTLKNKSNTLNELKKHAKYHYIALLDVDDIWHPEKLAVQSQMFGHYDVIGSNCVWFGERNHIIPSIPIGDFSLYDFKLVNPIINSSSVIRKELCYWNSYWNIEDYDLWIRLRLQNKKFYNCKAVLVKHRIHNTSAFNSKSNHNTVDELIKFHYK
jgi:glycosyltransferase involved in cell wall biosynthesis